MFTCRCRVGRTGFSRRCEGDIRESATLEIVAGLRGLRPELAITSDLIVGFPGETEADFEDTLDSFAPRGSRRQLQLQVLAAAGNGGGRDGAMKCRRRSLRSGSSVCRRQQRDQTLAYHQSRVGEETLVLIDGQSRRGGIQVSGRDPQNRVVNLDLRPGSRHRARHEISRRIVEATPHSPARGAPGDFDRCAANPSVGRFPDFTGSRHSRAAEADEPGVSTALRARQGTCCASL